MSGSAAPTIEVLDSRVRVLEARSSETLDTVKAIQAQLHSSGKPQYTVLFGGLAFMMTVLGFVGTSWKAPIETTVSRQDSDIRAIQAAIVPRAEHAERWRQNEDMLAAMRERVTRDMAAERAATVEGEKRIVERVERLESRVLFSVPGKRTELTRNP